MSAHRVVIAPERQDGGFEDVSDCAFCDAPRSPLLNLPVCGKHATKLYGEMRALIDDREPAGD